MNTFVLILITLAAGVAVLMPAVDAVRRPWAVAEPSGEGEALRQEELAALDALRDMAMDFKLGNLTEGDYRVLAGPLQQRTKRIRTLQAQHSPKVVVPDHLAAEMDDLLEAEIRSARRPVHNGAADGRATRFCPQCGAAVRAEDRFCGACGTALRPAAGRTAQAAPVETAPILPSAPVSAPVPAQTPAPVTPPVTLIAQATDAPSTPVVRRPWLWRVTAVLAVLWVVGVVGIYLRGRNSQLVQTPLAQFDGPVQSIAVGEGLLVLGTSNGAQHSKDG